MDGAVQPNAVSSTGPPGETVTARLSELPADAVAYVYRRLLIPSFRQEELVSLDEIRAAYGPSGADPSIVITADDLPVAVMLGEWYVDHRVLLLSYLSVDRRIRGTGLGTRLVREVLPQWCEGREVLVLAEVDDPRSWPASGDSGDPHARLRFYDRHGARLFPLRYFQPSLREGSPRVHSMLLLRLDRGLEASGELLAAFLQEYFTVCEGPEVLQEPQVSSLIAAARDLDLQRGAWPVSRWSEVPLS